MNDITLLPTFCVHFCCYFMEINYKSPFNITALLFRLQLFDASVQASRFY
jgi:hypothetical protein